MSGSSFFETRQKPLKIAVSLYVVFLILSHSTLPATHVWVIAAVFSILMNFTYLIEAYAQRRYFGIEFIIASTLIIASLLGVFLSPVFVILAIFGHGLWDLAKHQGAGISFFNWYTLSCFVVDSIYGSILVLYLIT